MRTSCQPHPALSPSDKQTRGGLSPSSPAESALLTRKFRRIIQGHCSLRHCLCAFFLSLPRQWHPTISSFTSAAPEIRHPTREQDALSSSGNRMQRNTRRDLAVRVSEPGRADRAPTGPAAETGRRADGASPCSPRRPRLGGSLPSACVSNEANNIPQAVGRHPLLP